MDIVKNLRESREGLDLLQKDVAKDLNVNDSTVSGWETGKDTIPIERLVTYAMRYQFSLDYLFGLTKNKKANKYLTLDKKLVGDNLRKLRKDNGLTQEYIANKLNTSQSTISEYEKGKKLINTTFLYNLTKIYKNFSIDDLFNKK